MKHWILACFGLVLILGCKRYTDPNPISDDRIKNPYCNDPSAVNYNWGFPGKPDNSVCIYPSAVFAGNFLVNDTVWGPNQVVLQTQAFPLQIIALDTVRMQLLGFCDTAKHSARANRFLRFTTDTLIGFGQTYCAGKDTLQVIGTQTNLFDTSGFDIEYILNTDTGMVYHKGRANKQ
ncbi:MAG: hypothetical protein FGM54_02660 [Chitinophagaceae bacterium]|nr:hypothetical protein [Chitinophagaceae bacterium]